MFSKTYLPKYSSYLYIGVYDFAGFIPYILMGYVIKLTDILGYSSKYFDSLHISVWYSELSCFRLSFVMTLLANAWSPEACIRKGEDIYDSHCDI